jgi:putative ABC transport system permease protein
MLALIAANVRRRRARTLLTAGGIAVGVAAVVALLALSAGLNRSAGDLVHLGQGDVGVFQSDASDPTASVLPLSLLRRIRAQPGIAQATPIQLVVGALPRSPGAIVFGLEQGGFAARQLVRTSSRPASRGHVLVGDLLARQLHLKPGDELRLERRAFRVVGTYHSGVTYEDAGVVSTLADAQALAGRAPDEVTTFAVKITPQTPLAKATRELERAFPDLTVLSAPGQAVRASANTIVISKAVLLIVVLALIIGALAVANTMLAAVLERRRELALLTTIGWSARQLGVLVLGEALAVSMLGTGAGLLLGLAASKLLPGALGLGAFISPVLTVWGLGRAILIGIAIGTLGAMYPTWRVTRMRSAVALALT